MAEEEKGFVVKDKRTFSSETGEPRRKGQKKPKKRLTRGKPRLENQNQQPKSRPRFLR